jgi:uncharacterized protein involved in high-affinity Fe2+ transport
MRRLASLLIAGLLLGAAPSAARETSLGAPVTRADAGMTLTLTWEPAVVLHGASAAGEPAFGAAERSQVFIAADVRAAKGNRNGFGAGEFVPYLALSYAVLRVGGEEVARGSLPPLVVPSGLRYGNNVRLPGPGRYLVVVTVEPPIKLGFGRHTDLETGVSRWWKPFQLEWTLQYPAPAR